jgi:hypothetical protein
LGGGALHHVRRIFIDNVQPKRVRDFFLFFLDFFGALYLTRAKKDFLLSNCAVDENVMFYSVLGVVGLLFGRGRYYLVFDRCPIGPSIMAKKCLVFLFSCECGRQNGYPKGFFESMEWQGFSG